MATLKNHPGFWLRDDAAASLARLEDDHGVFPINSAGRHEWEQQKLIDRWLQGGTYNRPPYLYEPKRPARASAHVKDGGIAIDTPEWRRFLQICAEYGWVQTYSWDVVHFEYNPARDKHRNRGAGASAPATPTPTPAQEEEEDEMKPRQIHYIDGKQIVRALLVPGTGYFVKWTEAGATYANGLATNMETSNSTPVTRSLFNVFQREAEALRPKGALSIEVAHVDEAE